ncbi:MAG: hypothetical protein ABDI19_09075 [Armatimonadota bacterium]
MRSISTQRLPQLPKLSDKLPRLDDLFKKEPPLTTSMADAPMPLRCLDEFQPTQFQPLDERHRLPDAKWKIPGVGLYEFTVHSFCGRIASYAPHKALGYLPAPYKGSRAKLLQAIIQRYPSHPELEQSDVQALIWAILAQAKPESFKTGVRRAAQTLLTEQELRSLNQQGLDALQDEVMRRLLPQVRDALRPLLEIENRVRQIIATLERPFEELERIVMRPFDPNDKILYEPQHWYWNPEGGYFHRYMPNGYSRTRIQVWVPRPVSIVYDGQGRIERLELQGQWSIGVEYDPSESPWRCPEDARLLAYRFRRVEFVRHDLGQREMVEVDGWLFVTEKRRSSRQGVQLASRSLIGWRQRQPSWIRQWIDRVRGINETRKEIDSYAEWANWGRRMWEGNPSADNLLDQQHYYEGIREALRGTTADRVGWIAETHRNAAEGLAYGIVALRQLPTGSERVYDPSGYLATPGSQGGQRLLTSGRGI